MERAVFLDRDGVLNRLIFNPCLLYTSFRFDFEGTKVVIHS